MCSSHYTQNSKIIHIFNIERESETRRGNSREREKERSGCDCHRTIAGELYTSDSTATRGERRFGNWDTAAGSAETEPIRKGRERVGTDTVKKAQRCFVLSSFRFLQFSFLLFLY